MKKLIITICLFFFLIGAKVIAQSGHYKNGKGSSHKGGHYKNTSTGNHYRKRK